MPQEDVFLDMGVLFKKVLKGLLWVIPFAALIAFGTFYLASKQSARYTSESKILIDTAKIVLPGQIRNSEQERSLLDKEGIASQVQLFQSRDLARHAVQKLDLENNRVFAAKSEPGLVDQLLTRAGFEPTFNQVSEAERLLNKFTRNLDVYQVDGSRVIAVRFKSKDPELAARIANTVVNEYRMLQDNAKRAVTSNTADALAPQVARLENEVEAAQRKAAEFRAGADLLLGSENRTLNQQQLAELSSQVSSAIVAKSQAEAQARQIRSLLEDGGALDTATQVLNSSLIQRLRERQLALENRIAELSTTLLPNHPQIKSLRSQRTVFDRQIRAEAEKIVIGLENDAKIAQDRYVTLNAQVNELKKEAARSGADQVRLQELEREARSKEEQLSQLLVSLREAEVLQGVGVLNADSRVISRASVPSEPSGRKPSALAAITGFAAFFLGCLWVIVRALVAGEVLRRESFSTPAAPAANPKEATGTATSNALNSVVDAAARSHTVAAPPIELKPSFEEEEEEAVAEEDEQHDSLTDYSEECASDDEAQDEEFDEELEDEHELVEVSPITFKEVKAENTNQLEKVRRVVVLSVEDESLSSRVALSCTRKIAARGIMPVVVEVRSEGGEGAVSVLDETPLEEIGDAPHAEECDDLVKPGFSELLEGEAAFTNVIHRDPVSRAHVIQSGVMPIRDEVVYGGRYNLIMEALDLTYDVIVADLGLIEPSLICAQMLSEADRVIIATDGSPAGPELEKALAILEKHTKAPVEVERVVSNEAAAWLQRDMAA
ncbi:chain-length determining protein [Pseudovibrio japonicus]|uniref:Chain-length determining protein n=1 Tax=Pseudovibrio japonicus TaxID=366534 RepID=A0ABQ3EF64_9HYPH|nr:GumC family protein [Pseudovibrio japonicus]GHB36476.1 chain-length determining protein [Pseudovibrio japonicus]